jgi:hypothetical protein
MLGPEQFGINPAVDGNPFEFAVERGEPLLQDFSLSRASNLDFKPRPQELRRQILGAPPKATRDVSGLNPQLPTFEVHAPDDHVRMRMVRIVVIDRSPLDRPPEIALNAQHQCAYILGQIEISTVFRRDDEAKLMPLVYARLLESLARHWAFRAIELARRTIPLDSFALDVSQMPSAA